MTRPLFILALLTLAAPAWAQMLPSGTWTGTLVQADGDRRPVEAAIERCATGFTMTLAVDGRTAEVPESAPATWRRGRLAFTTTRLRLPGTVLPRPLVCDLRADDDGRLVGTCTSGARRVRLELTPPADGVIGCD